MQLSEITHYDITECAPLYIDAFSGEPWCEKWSERKASERLRNIVDTPGFIGLKAKDNEVLVGMLVGNKEAFVPKDTYYLRDICVKSSCKRRGIGRSLIMRLHNILQKEGVGSVYLLSHRCSGREFYIRLGYHPSPLLEVLINTLD